MPSGTSASGNDSVPAQSPRQVTGIDLTQGGYLTFSATGAVGNNNNPLAPQDNWPDGGYTDGNFELGTHEDGAQNGIANTISPINALIGVFLSDTRPDTSATPESLDFTLNLSYTQISPLLKQPFFIGDGLTGDRTGTGQLQQVRIPAGATRLFLGSMDKYDYTNNTGGFTVTVTHHPQ